MASLKMWNEIACFGIRVSTASTVFTSTMFKGSLASSM